MIEDFQLKIEYLIKNILKYYMIYQLFEASGSFSFRAPN